MNTLTQNIKALFLPVSSIFIIVLLSYVVIQGGYSRLMGIYDNYDAIKKENTILKEKLESLRLVDRSVIDKSEIALLSMPEKNSATYVISNVRNYINSSDRQLIIEDISVVSDNPSQEKMGYASGLVSLSIKGNSFVDVIEVMKSLYDSIPISNLSAAKISESNGEVSAKIEIFNYWSDLPTQLPPITEPIVNINQDELNTLRELASYRKPQFVNTSIILNDSRLNPFQ